MTRLHEVKGACHLSELSGLNEMVLIGVNGRVKVDPCNYSRGPFVNDVKKHGGFSYETFEHSNNISSRFFLAG